MKKNIALGLISSMVISAFPAISFAAYDTNDDGNLTAVTYNYDGEDHTRYMEKLDRGLVAVRTDNGVFLSWRLLGDEASVSDIINAPDFKVYKNNELLATVDNSTNYLDADGTTEDSYYVVIEDGEPCEAVQPMENAYFDIALEKPEPFSYTEGENTYSYDYTVGDASCGDLDGDGEYEIVLKWDANPQDNSNGGITGKVKLDAYKLDGTRLWDKPIDLGRNIRAGAHYTQFLVYDFDGDGKAEITCKTAPGSKDANGAYVTEVSADNDIKNADNTKEYVNQGGYILEGPEYFTIFSGEGAAVDTINYPVARVNASVWGDKYGNRCDRFIADVSYLDGERPHAVYWRGYYFGQSGYSSRCGVFAASFDGKRLSVPEEHIFDTRSGQPGYTSGNERYVGEGNHNMTSGDFDDDGKDEFTAGALAFEFDDNGKLSPMWCTYKEHGDAIHIGDYDPTHQGLELFVVHEDGGGTNSYGGVYNDYGASVIDPATGEIIWHVGAAKDTGRGLMANVGAGGYYQVTASSGVGGYYSLGGGNMQKGVSIGYNFRIFWDGDLYDETLDGTSVSAWDGRAMSAIFNAGSYDCISINGTKSVPALQADLFGDWREELVYPTRDNGALRVFTTTDVTEYKLPTLMHDPVYRSGVASEQTAYNQPPHIGFYLADEIFRAAVEHIEITSLPEKDRYYIGEALDIKGLEVIAHFTDGSTDDVSEYVVVTGYDPSDAGEQTVTVTYSRQTADFTVYVDSGFTTDDDGYITDYTLGNDSAIMPDRISGQPVKGIREGALLSSGLKEITINAEELDIEENAFPNGIVINCMLGSTAYIYAVNNGIEYKTIDTREFISDVTYSEEEYNGFGFTMGRSAITKTIGHIKYGVGSRGDGDSTTGYYIDGDDNKYLVATVGRFSTRGRNLYFIINDMPLATDTVDNVFETDIMFNYGGGTPAMLMVSDSSGNYVDFVPRTTDGIENDVWYTYKLVYHNGSYYRSLVPKGDAESFEYIGSQSSESGASRIDIVPENYWEWPRSLDKAQSAAIRFDNTRAYTNVEISYLKLAVTDESGSEIAGADVMIGDTKYKTDRNGELSVPVLSGLYDISIAYDGYETAELTIPVFRSRIEKNIVLSRIALPLQSISFERSELALKVGGTAKAVVVTEPLNADETEFIFSSSDDDVAQVDASGTVTAKSAGEATITAVSANEPDIKTECIVKVYEPYTSELSTIEIYGPESAYIPNGYLQNAAELTARCFDQNGVEISAEGLTWTAEGGIKVSADGRLSIPSNIAAGDYSVYAKYNDITSNEHKITLVGYPPEDGLIAREDCNGALDIYQQNTSQEPVTLGDISYCVGARADGGDSFSGFYIGNYGGKKCLQAKAGKFGSAGREAYMVFDKIKDEYYYDPEREYVFETDMYCTGGEKIIFENSTIDDSADKSANDIIKLEPAVAGLKTNTWYHYMLIYSNGEYYQYVTDRNGKYVETNLPTVQSDHIISQIRFEKGEAERDTVYLYGLKYYTTDSAFSRITVTVRNSDGAAVSGATVASLGETLTTGVDGRAKLILPLGAYYISAEKDGLLMTASVMSYGANRSVELYLPPKPAINAVNGNEIKVSTNGEALKLYAAQYNDGVLVNASVFNVKEGTSVYTAEFEPDKVFLWDSRQVAVDKWEKE